MNEKQYWARWCFASFSKHFIENSQSSILYIEGTTRDTSLREIGEFRLDGPRITEISKNCFKLWFAVNILIQRTMDSDYGAIHTQAGKVLEAFAPSIEIFRFGSQPQDTGTSLGCATLLQDKNNKLRVNHFGQIDSTIKLEQATIEGHYHLFLEV